jgi:hypothetical protein
VGQFSTGVDIEHRPFFPSPSSCREWFVHPLKKGAQHHRLLPKERDYETYLAIVNGDGTLLRASANYEVIRGEKPDVSTNVTEALRKLNVLESSTTYPLLLRLFELRDGGAIDSASLARAIDMLSGFIRRAAKVASIRSTFMRSSRIQLSNAGNWGVVPVFPSPKSCHS